MAPLKAGDRAPDFDVAACTGEHKHRITLKEFRGKKHVILAFYPLDWTPVWGAQASAYHADREKFAELDAQVLGMSTDSVFSHIAWQKFEVGTLNFPLGSDFYPHGEVASKFGILRTGDPIPGINERAVFIIDKDGIIRSATVLDLGDAPDNEDAFKVLRELQSAAGSRV